MSLFLVIIWLLGNLFGIFPISVDTTYIVLAILVLIFVVDHKNFGKRGDG